MTKISSLKLEHGSKTSADYYIFFPDFSSLQLVLEE